MFLDPSSPIGDNLMYPFFYLGRQLKKMGHQVATIDTDDLKKFGAVVFVEFPGFNNPYFKELLNGKFSVKGDSASGKKNLYLILLESPIIKPDNYAQENHAYFKKIFTWSDTLVDNKTYFKIFLPVHGFNV
jgi:UDP:flavonoid glycosyltransferase YjiC (YdhE family)